MNRKRIYEYLKPELIGKEWEIDNGFPSNSNLYAKWYDEGWQTKYLPVLDEHTFFSEVLPKLESEGLYVSFNSCLVPKWKFTLVHKHLTEPGITWHETIAEGSDPYEMLSELLEGGLK